MKRIKLKIDSMQDRERLILALSNTRFIKVIENKLPGKITHEFYVLFDISDHELLIINEQEQ